MFNDDFYPTPTKIMDKWLRDIALKSEYTYLEPSAGKGNIVDYLHEKDREQQWRSDKGLSIDVIEIEPELRSILFDKDCVIVGEDFLSYKTNTEYDYIVMNPPFSDGALHLLHAIKLAEEQEIKDCHIYCLLNAETIRNPFSGTRQYLLNVLGELNAKIKYIENGFAGSERSTSVEVAAIQFTVPCVREKGYSVYEGIINGLDKGEDSEGDKFGLSVFVSSEKIVKRKRDIEILVKLYAEHVISLKQAFRSLKEFNSFNATLKTNYDSDLYNNLEMESNKRNYDSELKRLRVIYWELILETDEFNKILTEDGRAKIQKHLETSSSLEITIENVKMLLMSLYSNKGNMMKEALLNKFDDMTKHHMSSFSKNIHYYNGWKTNSAFKINKKIIIPSKGYGGDKHDLLSWGGKWQEYGRYGDTTSYVGDLIKALNIISDERIENSFENLGGGEYENKWFHLKCYIKGTTHITFKDLELLARFNIIAGQEKNWLPSDDEIKSSKEAQKFIIKEFGISSVKNLISAERSEV